MNFLGRTLYDILLLYYRAQVSMTIHYVVLHTCNMYIHTYMHTYILCESYSYGFVQTCSVLCVLSFFELM